MILKKVLFIRFDQVPNFFLCIKKKAITKKKHVKKK